jgi:hypothetical protein
MAGLDWGKNDPRDSGATSFGKDDAIELPEGVTPSAAGGGRGSVNPPAVQETVPEIPLGNPMGTGFEEIMAQPPKRQSVLEGVDMPAPTFGQQDAQEAERLSRRAYAERTPTVDDPRFTAPSARQGVLPPPKPASLMGSHLADMPVPVRAAANTITQGVQSLGGLTRAAGDAIGSRAVSDFGANAAKNASDFEEGMGTTPKIESDATLFGPQSPVHGAVDAANYTRRMGEAATSSILQSAGYATAFGPAAVIPMMWVAQSGQTYDDARKAGMEPAQALAYALPYGAFEAIGEKYGKLDKAAGALHVLMTRGAPRDAIRQAGATLVSAGIHEVPGEVLTYLGQSGMDALPGVGLRPDMTVSQWLDGLRDTVVQSAMMGGMTSGVGVAVMRNAASSRDKPIEKSAEEIMREKGFLVRQQQVDRLNKEGEKEVAGTMQRQLDSERAQAELETLGQKPWGQSDDFKQRYLDLRTAGTKPAEAAARAAMASSFGELAKSLGLTDKATQKAIEAAAGMPLEKVPAFLEGYVQSLSQRGMSHPVEPGIVQGTTGGPRDDALATQLERVYQEDTPAPTVDAITQLEKQHDEAAAAGPESGAGVEPGAEQPSEAAAAGAQAAKPDAGAAPAGPADAAGFDGQPRGEQSPKDRWLTALANQNRIQKDTDAKITGVVKGRASFMGDPNATKQGRALLATYNEAIKAGASPEEIERAISGKPSGFGGEDPNSNDAGAHQAAVSPENDLPEPTKAQILGGNAKLGHMIVGGLGVTIENPAGSVRRDLKHEPPQWQTPMEHGYHYGYFKRTEGADGDQVDGFFKEGLPENYDDTVWIVDQVDPKTGKFDEHKVVVGAKTYAEARAAYLAHYEKGWKGAGAITPMAWDQFTNWLRDGKRAEPVAKLPAPRQNAAPQDSTAAGVPAQPEPGSQQASAAPQPEAAKAEQRDESPPDGGHIGRDSIPLSDGGKPFRTELEARKTKRKHPDKRVVRVEGGFALAPKTPAQLEAEARAAKRLRSGATEKKGQPIAAHAFIAGHGGLHRDAMSELGFDKNLQVGSRWLFAKDGGLTLEQATELLHQHGYISEEDQRAAIDTLSRSAKGEPQYTPEGWEAIAQAEGKTQFEDFHKAISDDESLRPELDAEALQGSGFEELTPDEREQFYALVAAAHAEGIDTEAILRQAEYATRKGNEDDFTDQGLKAYRADASRRLSAALAARPGAGAEGGQGHDRPAGAGQGRQSADFGGDDSRSEVQGAAGNQPVESPEEVAPSPAGTRYSESEGGIERERQEDAEAERERALRTKLRKNEALREAFKSPNGANDPDIGSTSATDFIEGFEAAKAGTPIDDSRVSKTASNMKLTGFNPVDSYLSGYFSGLTGKPQRVRTVRSEADVQKLMAAVEAKHPGALTDMAQALGAKTEEAAPDPDKVVNGKPLDPSVKPSEALLLMPCAEGKVFPASGKNTAANVYQGAYWEVFRKRTLPSGATPVDNWLILSAKHGLMDPGQMIGPYDEKMTPERAKELAAQAGKLVRANWGVLSGNFRDVQIVGGADYRTVMRAIVAELQASGSIAPDAAIRETTGGIGEQRSQLGAYMDGILAAHGIKAEGEPQEAAPAAAPAPAAKNAKAEALRAAGQRMIDKATEEQNRDRNTNTARRARIASGAEANARAAEAMGRTMVNLADAIDRGDAPLLATITQKAQVETLDAILRRAMHENDRRTASYAEQEKRKGRAPEQSDVDAAKLPRTSWQSAERDAHALLEKIKGKKGNADLAMRLRRHDAPNAEMLAALRKLGVSDKDITYSMGWWNLSAIEELQRMKRAGITNDKELRAVLEQYLAVRGGAKAEDPVKALERKLIGQRVGIDFFPTPAAVAQRMVQDAGIRAGMRVLEPSAGNGNIADAARAAGAKVDVVEVSSQLRELLQAKGYSVVGQDFMKFTPSEPYDAIVMNPPFSDRMDAQHIQHAYGMLKPGGKLVAIAGEGVFFGSDKKAQAFREWLDERGAEVEKLPPGTFNDAKLLAQTGTNARVLVIEKPATEAREPEQDLFGAKPNASQQEAERLRAEKAEKERKQQQNVPEPADFTLTGSNRPADEAAAKGQNELFEPDRPYETDLFGAPLPRQQNLPDAGGGTCSTPTRAHPGTSGRTARRRPTR